MESALLVVNQAGTILYANKAAEDLFGYRVEYILGKEVDLLLMPISRKNHQHYIADFFKQAVKRDKTEEMSFPAQHQNGKIIRVNIALNPIAYDAQTSVLVTLTEALNVQNSDASLSDTKANLASSLYTNKRLIEVAKNSTDAVFVLDQTCKITWANHAAVSMMKMSQRALKYTDILGYIHRDTQNDESKKFAYAVAHGLSFNGELQLLSAAGLLIQVDCTLQPVFNGELMQGFSLIAKDITKRRAFETQMRENNELLETIARIAKLGFYSLDIQTNALTWSDEVYNIHDLPKHHPITVEEAIAFYAPESRRAIHAAAEKCMTTGQAFDLELPFITAKNRRIWVRSVGYAEFSNGQPIQLKGAFQDITYMRQAALDAEQAANAKSNFLANMSHELRTPISGILGISELLSETKLSAKQHEYLSMISKSGASLLFLVNQVLDYAKLDSGSQTLSKSIFGLRQFVKEKTYIHVLAAQEKNCNFTMTIADDVEDSFYGDIDRLGQVLNNLCSNAVKFTEKGDIEVSLHNVDNASIKFSVQDSGVGIRKQDQSKLFTEFKQLDSSYSRPHQGTGLGLTISKQLVNLMKGKIGFNSAYGIGSTFWFTVPFSTIGSGKKRVNKNAILPNTLILTCDEKQHKLWNELATQQCVNLQTCKSVAEILKSLKNNKHWQLIVIMDLPDNIPLFTCIASVARVVNSKHKIILNQHLYDDLNLDQNNSALLGNVFALDFKAKPDLHSSIARCYWQFETLLEWYTDNNKKTAVDWANKHILVAEDNPINQVLFTELLGHTRVKLSIVDNGLAAIHALENDASIDLVVMDCQMPVMDGFEATRRIRQHVNQRIADIRIAAATAHGFEDDIQACFNVGMNDVLVKPFSKQQLIDMILRNL